MNNDEKEIILDKIAKMENQITKLETDIREIHSSYDINNIINEIAKRQISYIKSLYVV